MRPRAALKRIKALLKAPSFTSKDAARLDVSAATLGHYVKLGELERLGRGVYRATSSTVVEDFRWGDLINATRTVKDGVICLTSALAVYGLTEEVPRQHWIAVRHTTKHRGPASTKAVRMRNFELGRTQVRLGGVTVPIFDRERTIIDAFRYLGRETAIKALKLAFTKKRAERIDPEKLLRYSRVLRVIIEPYLLAVAA
jgi:predicted transcriptional regulator of viral defense system